jgi:dienelactone hydrolase
MNSFPRVFRSLFFVVGFFIFTASTPDFCPPARAQNEDNAGFVSATIDAAANGAHEPRWVRLPSALPSGDADNDKIWFKWYPARGLKLNSSAPAVLLLHPLGEQGQTPMHKYARYLATRGISAAVVMLPFHDERLAPGENSFRHFVSPNIEQNVAALQQSVADARTVTDWMSTQPNVDTARMGAVGISLGAIITHLVMGQDERIKAGVAVLGGGALAESYKHSPLAHSKILYRLLTGSSDFGTVSPEALKKLDAVDPVTYAKNFPPRNVLMIEAARDIVVPPFSTEKLWQEFDKKPPIQWLDTNHFSPISLAKDSVLRASVAYLNAVWNGAPLAARDIPEVRAPTLKFGVVMNLDSVVTPAAQWQFFSLGTREHRALLGANLGMSGRGPFLGLAANVTPTFDIGLARRLGGERIRPYASLHFVY